MFRFVPYPHLLLSLALLLITGMLSCAYASPEGDLDAAIALCQQGRTQAALKAFDALEHRYHPPEGIMALINHYREHQCQNINSTKDWQAQLSIGNNSNVNQGTYHDQIQLSGLIGQPTLALADSSKAKGDQFKQINLSYQKDNWQWGINLRQYASYSSYDTAGVYGRWQGKHAAIDLFANTLGGIFYQHSTTLSLFGPLSNPNWQLGVKFKHQRYPSLPSYDNIAVEPYILANLSPFALYLSTSVDTPDARRPGGKRQNVTGLVQYSHLLNNAVLDANLYLMALRESLVFSEGIFNDKRQQDYAWLQLRYTQPLTAQDAYFVEASYGDSRDTISLYDYNATQLAIGWQSKW